MVDLTIAGILALSDDPTRRERVRAEATAELDRRKLRGACEDFMLGAVDAPEFSSLVVEATRVYGEPWCEAVAAHFGCKRSNVRRWALGVARPAFHVQRAVANFTLDYRPLPPADLG